MDTISLPELYQHAKEASPTRCIVDVRTPAEYAEGHIAGSRNLPLTHLLDHVETLSHYEEVDIHCMHGVRAQRAYHLLTEAGCKNLHVLADCGFQAWVESGYPYSLPDGSVR